MNVDFTDIGLIMEQVAKKRIYEDASSLLNKARDIQIRLKDSDIDKNEQKFMLKEILNSL